MQIKRTLIELLSSSKIIEQKPNLAAAAVVHSAMAVAMQETAGAVVTSLVTVVTDLKEL